MEKSRIVEKEKRRIEERRKGKKEKRRKGEKGEKEKGERRKEREQEQEIANLNTVLFILYFEYFTLNTLLSMSQSSLERS